MDLLLELVDVEDEAEREAIYDKIAEHEMKRMRMEIFDRWLESKEKQEFITLGLQLDPKATKEEMEALFDKSMKGYQSKEAARMDEEKEEKQRPTLEDFFDAKDRKEKEAILQEMYGGTLTPEELEAFFPKD